MWYSCEFIQVFSPLSSTQLFFFFLLYFQVFLIFPLRLFTHIHTHCHTPGIRSLTGRRSLLNPSDANGRWPLAGEGDNKIIQWGFGAGPHTKEGRWAHLPSAGMAWKWGARGQRRPEHRLGEIRGRGGGEWEWQLPSASHGWAAVSWTNRSSAISTRQSLRTTSTWKHTVTCIKWPDGF